MPQLVYDETSRLTHEFPDDASPDEIQSALNSISPIKSKPSESPSLRASAPDAPGFDIRGSRASQFGVSAPMASAPSFPSQVGPNPELAQPRKVILNPEWMQEQTPLQVVGQATKQIGDVGVGVTADVAETLTGNPTTENIRAAVMGRPIPMKEFIEAQPQGITRFSGRATTSVLETAPKLAQTAALTALGVPAALSAGLPFSVNKEGKVDLVSGAVAAGVGPAFEAGQMLTASALSKIPIAKIVLNKIEENPDIFGFRVIQKLGPNLPTLESEMVRKGLEQTGGTIAANLFLGAAQVPGIMSLPPEQRAGATMDALADNFAMSLLGFAPIFSKTSSETMNKLYSSIQRSAKRDLGREVRGPKLADVPGETVPGTVTPPEPIIPQQETPNATVQNIPEGSVPRISSRSPIPENASEIGQTGGTIPNGGGGLVRTGQSLASEASASASEVKAARTAVDQAEQLTAISEKQATLLRAQLNGLVSQSRVRNITFGLGHITADVIASQQNATEPAPILPVAQALESQKNLPPAVAPPTVKESLPVAAPTELATAKPANENIKKETSAVVRVAANPEEPTAAGGKTNPPNVEGVFQKPKQKSLIQSETKGETAAKEPWQMTKVEFVDNLVKQSEANPDLPIPGVKQVKGVWKSSDSKITFKSKRDAIAYAIDAQPNRYLTHKYAIEKAIQENKPVPESVLADYPDLSKPSTPPAAALSAAIKAVVENPFDTSETSKRLTDLQKSKPRPLNKLYGPNPKPEQTESHKAVTKAWNRDYRAAQKAHKETVEKSNKWLDDKQWAEAKAELAAEQAAEAKAIQDKQQQDLFAPKPTERQSKGEAVVVPWGFWIASDGTMRPVSMMQHDVEAKRILAELGNPYDEHAGLGAPEYQVDKLGYARGVFDRKSNTLLVDSSHPLSRLAKTSIRDFAIERNINAVFGSDTSLSGGGRKEEIHREDSRSSVGSNVQNPISEQDATRAVLQTLGATEMPSNIRFTSNETDPAGRVLMLPGFRPQIELNLAKIGSAGDLVQILYEELIHPFQLDPAYRHLFDPVRALVTAEDIQRQREEGYKEQSEEEAVNETTRRLADRNIFQRLIDWIVRKVKELFGIKLNPEQAGRAAARTILREAVANKVAAQAVGERGSEPPKWGEMKREETLRNSIKDTAVRRVLGPAERDAGFDYAKQQFSDVGLKVNPGIGNFLFIDQNEKSFDNQPALERLLERVKWTVAHSRELPDFGNAFLQSVREMMAGQQAQMKRGEPTMFTNLDTFNQLTQLSRAHFSEPAQRLGMMVRNKDDILESSTNLDEAINYEIDNGYFGGVAGPVVTSIIDEIKRQVGDDFSNDETVRTSIENILTRANPPDPGSIVYKLAQGRLKPKQKATLIQLLNHAKVQEAVQSIIELAKASGVSEPKPKTVPLTPSQKLMAMVEPKNAVAIDAAVNNAVRQAERNAGRAAFEVESAASADDMALYDAETIKEGDGQGISPTPEQVEKGFNTPEFSHWRVIRDNLLGYSPVTDRLIRQVIQSEIKGTNFTDPTKPKKLDAREIDLNELSRQPDAEVNRVFQAYLDTVGSGMDMHNASPVTKQRILALINAEIVKQLELKRSKIRDPFFAPKREPYAKPTADQAIRDALNAGLFKDDRINLADMVTRVASKSAVKRLLPNIPDLIKTVLATPVKNQRELGQAFADELSRKIGVPDEQADAAAKVFSEAYRSKFEKARENALKSASESLSPEQKTVLFKNGKQLFNKISDFIRAGGMDDNEFFRQYAKEKWGERRVPTDADINKLRALVEKEDALRQLTPAEVVKAGGDPAKLEAARNERLKVTETERCLIQRQIEAMMKEWGSPTARTPREWVMDPVLRRNWNAARNELNSSNVLLGVAKLGRQLLDTATMQMWYIPHRAIANTWQGFRNQLANGQEPDRIELFKNFGHDIGQVLKVRLDTIRHSIIAFQQGIRGRGLPTHIEQLQSGMMMAERLNMRADEMAKRGDPLGTVRSWLMRLWALQTLGHRQFAAMDVLQAKSAIWQEMMSQVISGLRERGMTNAEIKIQTDTIFGNIAADLITARNDAEAMLTTPDSTPTKGEIDLAAWELLQTRLYARIKALGLPADDFENRNKAYAETIAWNLPPSGPGGIYSKSAKNLQKYLERFIPIPPLFGNAVGTSLNRALTWFGFGLGSEMFTGKNERGENTTDPWFESDVDKLHRKSEAITGLGITAILGALTMLGVIVVRLAWPKDKKEREEWQAKGISPYTVEFPLGNGQSLKIPLRIGPLAPMAGGLAGFSAMRTLLDSKSKEQARLNAEAARLGVEPGKVTPINAADLLAVAGQSALNMMTGGRTAAGMLGTYSDFGTPNVGRMVSGVVTPMVPLLPAYQELTRLAGVQVDASTGSFWDLLVPSPWSPKRRVNMLGDDVSTPGAVERIFSIVTLGGGVTGGVAKENTAYADLYATGARPSAISPTKGYDFNGTLRPMTRDELAEYARLRGSNLKEGLMALGSVDGMSPEDAKTAVQGVIKEAQQKALSSMGVNVRTPASTRTAGAPSSARRGAFGRRTRLIRPSRTRNLSAGRIRTFRRPSLIGGQSRRRALSTTRRRRSLVA